MKTAIAALLTAIVLSVSAAYGAETASGQGKRPLPRQTQKMSKPAEFIVDTRKYLADKASKTAEFIRTKAAKIRQSVWPQMRLEPEPAPQALTQERKAARKKNRDQPVTAD